MESNYKKLGLVISINTVVMFLLTYALIDSGITSIRTSTGCIWH